MQLQWLLLSALNVSGINAQNNHMMGNFNIMKSPQSDTLLPPPFHNTCKQVKSR